MRPEGIQRSIVTRGRRLWQWFVLLLLLGACTGTYDLTVENRENHDLMVQFGVHAHQRSNLAANPTPFHVPAGETVVVRAAVLAPSSLGEASELLTTIVTTVFGGEVETLRLSASALQACGNYIRLAPRLGDWALADTASRYDQLQILYLQKQYQQLLLATDFLADDDGYDQWFRLHYGERVGSAIGEAYTAMQRGLLLLRYLAALKLNDPITARAVDEYAAAEFPEYWMYIIDSDEEIASLHASAAERDARR